jgi:hypothetical protein
MLAIWQALPAAERARFGQRAPLQDEDRPRTRGSATTQRTTVAPQTKDLRSVS